MRYELLPMRPKAIEKRRVRFDKVAQGAVVPRVECRSLIGLFRLWKDQPPEERRRLPRHAVVESEVWLGWQRGEEGFRAVSALIINLSRGGALIFLDEKPPRNQAVWISQGTDPAGRIEARVIATRMTRLKQCAVRLEFLEPCPYDFFSAAVCGLPPADPRRRNRCSAARGGEGDPATKS